MTADGQYKDFYTMLGLSRNASHKAIDVAYRTLAQKWHPEKNTTDRAYAQRMFNDITQAFSVLSNQARRDYYDQLTATNFGKNEALKTFDQFFKYNGIEEEEKAVFDKIRPEHKPNYYELLRLRRDASFEEVDEAFRRISLDFHPKNSPKEPEAEAKFLEMSKAYATLMNPDKRRVYDNLESGEFPTPYSHRQFVENVEGCTKFHGDKGNQELSGLVSQLSHKGKKRHHKQPAEVYEEFTKETIESQGP